MTYRSDLIPNIAVLLRSNAEQLNASPPASITTSDREFFRNNDYKTIQRNIFL